MKIWTISHDTRCDGVGSLNGDSFSSEKKAIKAIEKWLGDEHEPPFVEAGNIGWTKEGDFYNEDNTIEIYSQKID
jgi:hypothetical protein